MYRKRKLLAFFVLWDRIGKKQYSTARINTCCYYEHEILSFCRIDTPKSLSWKDVCGCVDCRYGQYEESPSEDDEEEESHDSDHECVEESDSDFLGD